MKLRMGGLLLLLGVFMAAVPFSYGISVSCMAAYDEGGAPAVFKSPECPDWVLSHYNQTLKCLYASTQGRRQYQEDRISCNLDMQIPLIGKNGPLDTRVGAVAVFDGHIGQEASEMASKLFLDFFYLHSVFGSFKGSFPFNRENSNYMSHSSEGTFPVISGSSSQNEVLKEALLRTIHDIDLTFTKVALENEFASGSTAVVALLVDGQILVANVGDSKALLCSEKHHPHKNVDGASVTFLSPKELTNDHNAHRPEERARIEAAGGFIFERHDVPLINYHFPMTRAIGDVPMKRYGIIPEPEVTDWQTLNASDSHLVVASDGIFESLKPRDVCNLIQEAHFKGNGKSKKSSPCSSSSSLADCIIHNAFKKGSVDNLSAVVVPL